ncbi:MAG TPA: IS5 family transposase [Flavisolibacter sp.]|nr:IS5 family transposase [Flavisolibacter sp.]
MKGKGSKIMVMTNWSSRPFSLLVDSATPHECRLAEQTVANRFAHKQPLKLVADRAYDNDPLDRRLKRKNIELIAPHRVNRLIPKTQDGRKLRLYKQRWRIERFFSWLFNFRRCAVRYERKAENFLGFIQLASIIMLLRYF